MASSYSRLSIVGPISVEPISKVQSPETTFMILLMGPTGAGKSAFVECIGNRKDLGISKDQLEGFTNDVRAYRLVNVVYGHGSSPINFIDTPGFLDRKIPETRALAMIREWMKQNEVEAVHRIIYFQRITDTRVAGSTGRILKLFRALTGESTGSNITVATTMWDTLWTDMQRKRAQGRFNELGESHWKTFVEEGMVITKYENDHKSAMETLNNALRAGVWERFGVDDYLEGRVPMGSTKFGPLLHDNLIQRKSALQQRLQMIRDDLKEGYAKTNPTLEGVLLKDEADAKSDLKVIEKEIDQFGPMTAVHNRLGITGPISVEPIEMVQDVDVTFIILLIGPTGAGKSTFIERLCDKHHASLEISTDTLEGGTQKITAYRLVNAVYGHGSSPIIIIDTPGLLETNIPETSIFKDIQEWMKKNNVENIHRMVYFHRITDNRMSYGISSAIDMFRGITGESTGSSISIATTMWDRLWSTAQRQREDKRFEELREVWFKDFIDEGTPILKFDNDQNSALAILNETLTPGSSIPFHIEQLSRNNSHPGSGPKMRQLLYAGLKSRLHTIEERLRFAENGHHDEGAHGRPLEWQEVISKCKADTAILDREIQDLKDNTQLEEATLKVFTHPSNAASSIAPNTSLAAQGATLHDRRFSGQFPSGEKPLPPIPISYSISAPPSRKTTSEQSQRLVDRLELSTQRIKHIFSRKR